VADSFGNRWVEQDQAGGEPLRQANTVRVKKNPTRLSPVGFQIHPFWKAGGDGVNYINLNSPRPLSVCDARYKFSVCF
jgi:hypothetical protein